MEINWRDDGITRNYISEHPEMLGDLSHIKARELGCAATYCKDWNNPFIYELLRRSNHLDKWNKATDDKERGKILDKSCRHHGFMLM